MQHILLSLFGGILIGLSATLLLWLNGRIAGISGAFFGLFSVGNQQRGWQFAFLFGLMVFGGLTAFILGDIPVVRTSPIIIISAGLLVGIGTRLGNGCTSGHGVCGLGRLSLRSLVAVITFMLAAIITVFIQRHIF